MFNDFPFSPFHPNTLVEVSIPANLW